MSDHSHHEEPAKPAIEQDARIARVLGVALIIVGTVFGFYVGTVGGKPWTMDYQPADMIPGLKGSCVGIVLALIVNTVMYTWYKKVVAADAEKEWYGPQSGHGHH